MRQYILIALMPLLTLAAVDVAISQNSSMPSASRATSADAPSTTDRRPALMPGFADLMALLVQPRHVKLYYAARERNWELAAFESRNLRAAFRRIGDYMPTYLNRDVNEAVTAMIVKRIDAVDAAVAAADEAEFARVYSELTEGCNACHVYMEHRFVIIKVPEAVSPIDHLDQQFSPTP